MPGGPDRIDADANSAIRSQEPVVFVVAFSGRDQ
jgi:hypothetical protein